MSDNDNSFLNYFKLSDAVDDISSSFGKKETAIAGAKLIGKTIFNVGLFAGKVGVEIIKDIPNQNGRKAKEILNSNTDLTDEQKDKLSNIIKNQKMVKNH